MPSHNETRALVARWLVVLAVLGATMFGFAPFAEAHTDFKSSTPADGEVLDQPVSEIRLRFTAASIVAGDGFVVLTPSGQLVQPEIRVSEDEREFILMFDPALTDGVVGVQWSVRAGDAHPIEGALSFTTIATAPAADPALSQPEGLADDRDPVGEDSNSSELASAPAAAVSLEEFLSTDSSSGGAAGPIGYLGRLASQLGSLVAIGVLGFVLLVRRPAANETTMFMYLIRQAAAVTLLGATLRAIALVMEFGALSDALIGSTGLAVGLRAVGATALLVSTASNRTAGVQQNVAAALGERALVTVGGGSFSGAIGLPDDELADLSSSTPRVQQWDLTGPIALWSAAAIAVSFVFDGHTVSKGNHLLTGLVAVVHVVGGSVWLGGLICLVLLSRRRSLAGQGSDFLATVVRFSVVAAGALAAVGIAGLILTVTILDSVSELWATAWGRILMAKVLIVAVAVAAGAFNHFVLVPEMRSISAHDDARQAFVRTIVVELTAICVAVAVTAFLVAAAS